MRYRTLLKGALLIIALITTANQTSAITINRTLANNRIGIIKAIGKIDAIPAINPTANIEGAISANLVRVRGSIIG